MDRRSKKAGLLCRSGVQDLHFISSCLYELSSVLPVFWLRHVFSAYVARTRPILLQTEPMPCNVNWFLPLCRKSAGLGLLCVVHKHTERVRMVSFTGSLGTETIVVSRRLFTSRCYLHLYYPSRIKVDSHIACLSHAAPMPFLCRAVPLRV